MMIDEKLPSGSGPPYNALTLEGVKSRRVVEMNPAGFIVCDRTWKIVDGTPELLNQAGDYESYVYDQNGRLIETRSRGWSSAGNTSPTSDGLIHKFEYFEPSDGNKKGELKAESIKKGAAGTPYYIRRYERDESDHPELVTREIRYAEPTDNSASTAGEIIDTSYEFKPCDPGENPCEEADRPVIAKTIVRSPTLRSQSSSTVYSAVEKFEYNDNGNLEWYGVGSLQNPSTPQAGDEFFLSFAGYDTYGRPLVQVVDFDGSLQQGTHWPTNDVSFPPVAPAGWSRVSTTNALNYKTIREYDPTFGLVRTIFPNDREQRIAYDRPPGGLELFRWTFNDLLPNTTPFQTLSPIQIQLIRDDRLVWDRKIHLLPGDTDELPDGHGRESQARGDAYAGIISTMTPTYDENGRLVGVQQGGADSSAVSGGISYDGFGNINRQQQPDGTITRNVYDELGRLWRVYRGTNDEHEYWQTAMHCTSPENPPGCIPEGQEFPDNLTLIEKRCYGTGVTNAGQLIEVRSYRDHPVNQYNDTGDDPNNPWPPSNEDQIGCVTNYDYDWRMRPVCEIRKDTTGAILNQTFTWYDNLNRPRFVAEYGTTAPTTWPENPTLLPPDGTLPAMIVHEILTTTPLPLSLTESIYNLRGQIEENRRYNVTSGSHPTYTATLTYYDHANRPVEVVSPNSPVQQYVYDAKGRQVVRRTLAGGIEVSASETTYDTNDRVEQATNWERKHNASGTALDENNSVKSYVQSWYDMAGRLVATANFGTNNTGFTSGTDPYESYNPLAPPAVGGLGPQVLVTRYEYDGAGRQNAVFQPDGTVTRSEYDDLGRLRLQTENADDATHPDRIQRTAYLYDDQGRLEKIAAVLPNHAGGITEYSNINWGASDGTLQVTSMTYGADVVDSTGAGISANNGFIKEVHFPGKADGLPDADDKLVFTYYPDGSVASRTDAKGNVFTYTYDELGRRTATAIDDSSWYPAPPPGSPTFAPPNRIHLITYEYDDQGNLLHVKAYGKDEEGAPNVLICANDYDYDEWGNLTQEVQGHESGTGSKTVDYEWEFSPMSSGYNFNRLERILYPPKVGGSGADGRLTVEHGHGTQPGDLDSVLNRITSITSPTLGTFSNYTYGGLSRRISSALGCGVGQTVDPDNNGTYTGLDYLGRLTDLNFTTSSLQPVHRYQYGYDLAGNRTFARVTQKAVGSTPHDNDRSSLYAYDGLHRLIDWQMGELNENNNVIESYQENVRPHPRTITWDLDNLGNWTGTGTNPYGEIRTGDFNGDEVLDTWNFDHVVNSANQVTERWTAGTNPNPAYTFDPNGNMVHDWQYYYQYDAFNRLIQVNEIGSAVVTSEGRLTAETQELLGALICRYTYDGLGRLIHKETPVSQGQTNLQVKNLYYDGVRRIQENITRPDIIEQMVSGGGQQQQAQFATSGPVENDELAVKIVNAEPIEGGESPPQTLLAGGGPEIPGEIYTDRQYVYGPEYVDEFVCQIDRGNNKFYMLQDANYNVVAILGPTGNVRTQYTYEPYGQIVAAESPSGGSPMTPLNRVGHQGLFFERYDGDSTGLTIAPTNVGLYYNRNRFYSPMLGRFIQRDPNETGMSILSALASNGEALFLLVDSFKAQSLYGDGMNLYLYVGSNPVNHRDALGLDDFDDAIDGLAGQNLYVIGTLNESARVASIGLGLALDIASGLLGIDVFQSVAILASGGGGFWEAMEIVMTVNPIGKLGKAAGKIGKAFQLMRRGGKLGRAIGTAAEHLFKILPYKQAQKLTKGFNHEIEAHHILEVRHAERWGINTNNVPAVILPKGQHDEITAALRQRLPYSTRTTERIYDQQQVWQAYQDVYRDYPDWLNAIEPYFR